MHSPVTASGVTNSPQLVLLWDSMKQGVTWETGPNTAFQNSPLWPASAKKAPFSRFQNLPKQYQQLGTNSHMWASGGHVRCEARQGGIALSTAVRQAMSRQGRYVDEWGHQGGRGFLSYSTLSNIKQSGLARNKVNPLRMLKPCLLTFQEESRLKNIWRMRLELY